MAVMDTYDTDHDSHHLGYELAHHGRTPDDG